MSEAWKQIEEKYKGLDMAGKRAALAGLVLLMDELKDIDAEEIGEDYVFDGVVSATIVHGKALNLVSSHIQEIKYLMFAEANAMDDARHQRATP